MADLNIALNRPVTASSYVLPYEPARAVNGTTQATSRWLCKTLPGYMTVDLGNTNVITSWTVKHMGAAGWRTPDYNMCNFALQGSNNNTNWVTIDSVVNNTVAITSRTVVPCAYRFVRLNVTKGLNTNPQLASVMELEVYGHLPNSSLASLSISNGALTPTFNPTTLAYTAPKVPYGTTSVVVSAIAADPTSTIKVNGVVMTGGQSTVNLNVGVNTINVLVTALNGSTKTYTITVEREQGAVLSNLTISSGSLNPTFSSGNLTYTTQNVGYDTASVTVVPTTNIAGCTITVNGNAATSGQPSNVNLAVGSNTINIVVTNGAASQTYTIAVVRESSLYLDTVNLAYTGDRFTYSAVVDMNQTTFSYTTSVNKKASSVVITPIAETNGASVTITSNGSSQTIASGTASSAISLPNTANTISLVVSKSGATGTKNYTLTINKV